MNAKKEFINVIQDEDVDSHKYESYSLSEVIHSSSVFIPVHSI